MNTLSSVSPDPWGWELRFHKCRRSAPVAFHRPFFIPEDRTRSLLTWCWAPGWPQRELSSTHLPLQPPSETKREHFPLVGAARGDFKSFTPQLGTIAKQISLGEPNTLSAEDRAHGLFLRACFEGVVRVLGLANLMGPTEQFCSKPLLRVVNERLVWTRMALRYGKSVGGRGDLMGGVWVMPCGGHLVQILQGADILMDFEEQTFCLFCSFKVPRCPQGCQHCT